MSAIAESEPVANAWEGTSLWTWLYLGSAVVITAFVLLSDAGSWRKLTGAALAGMSIITFLLFDRGGRRDHAAGCSSRSATVYMTLTLALGIGLFAVHPLYFMQLFGLFPLCFLGVDSWGWRSVYAAALGLGMGIGLAGWTGWHRGAWISGLAQGLISVGFAVGIGRWIDRIIEQSKDRRALLDELESTRLELAAAHGAAGLNAERQRLAGEIHDTLAQGFTSIPMVARGAAGVLGRSDGEAARLLFVSKATVKTHLIRVVAKPGVDDRTAAVTVVMQRGMLPSPR